MLILLLLWMKEIIERGHHESLMQQRGWYYETYQAQALQAKLSRNLDNLTKGDGEDD